MVNSTFNLCYAHTVPGIMEATVKRFKQAVTNLKVFIESPNPKKYLKGDLVQTTFKVR